MKLSISKLSHDGDKITVVPITSLNDGVSVSVSMSVMPLSVVAGAQTAA
jgi:hypothetical protein